MKTAVIVFPASNCDRDVAVALETITGEKPAMVWHGETSLPKAELIVLPGGFSYGDYLRCGAMAAHSPVMRAVVDAARGGAPVLGICNGFQILCETGLLPGVLLRNAHLRFVCRLVTCEVGATDSLYTAGYQAGQQVKLPVAHGDGNYFADDATLDHLEGENRIAFRYAANDNPNGAARNIAGILSEDRRILGLMPHPERVIEPALGGTDGRTLFESVLRSLS